MLCIEDGVAFWQRIDRKFESEAKHRLYLVFELGCSQSISQASTIAAHLILGSNVEVRSKAIEPVCGCAPRSGPPVSEQALRLLRVASWAAFLWSTDSAVPWPRESTERETLISRPTESRYRRRCCRYLAIGYR